LTPPTVPLSWLTVNSDDSFAVTPEINSMHVNTQNRDTRRDRTRRDSGLGFANSDSTVQNTPPPMPERVLPPNSSGLVWRSIRHTTIPTTTMIASRMPTLRRNRRLSTLSTTREIPLAGSGLVAIARPSV